MLLPSVLVLAALLIAHAPGLPYQLSWFFPPSIAVAAALCFWFGFRLEEWQRGEFKSVVRAIGLGFLILVNNCCIFIAGCTVIIFPDLK